MLSGAPNKKGKIIGATEQGMTFRARLSDSKEPVKENSRRKETARRMVCRWHSNSFPAEPLQEEQGKTKTPSPEGNMGNIRQLGRIRASTNCLRRGRKCKSYEGEGPDHGSN